MLKWLDKYKETFLLLDDGGKALIEYFQDVKGGATLILQEALEASFSICSSGWSSWILCGH